jgi:hypothetical protein
MAKTSAEFAIELRGKFEFYLLALTFSILGLSIQTAAFGDSLLVDVLELAGWLALFASGMYGLLRAQWVPVAYEIQSKIHATRERRADLLRAAERGIERQIPFVDEGGKETVLSGASAAAKFDGMVTILEQQYKETELKVMRRYNIMMWAFLVGIGCLLLARGLPHAISIGERAVRWLD